MDLNIKNHLFIVCGATSGFGRAVAETLLGEGAHVIAIARREDKLDELSDKYPGKVTKVCCDITQPGAVTEIKKGLNDRQLHGILVNAGGPPAMRVMETTLEDWDNAYRILLRWKIDVTQSLIPLMADKKYGRVVYIESASVKQPMENLVLSNSLRLSVVGYVKSLSQDVIDKVADLNYFAKLNSFKGRETRGAFEIQGVPKCIGHTCRWKRQKEGTGALSITDIDENHVYFDLQIIKPLKLRASSNWFFEEWGNGETKVIWQNHGNFSFPLTRLMGKIILRNLNHRSRMTLTKLKLLCEGESESREVRLP